MSRLKNCFLNKILLLNRIVFKEKETYFLKKRDVDKSGVNLKLA